MSKSSQEAETALTVAEVADAKPIGRDDTEHTAQLETTPGVLSNNKPDGD